MKKISELFKDIVRCIAIGITISAIISIAISIMCVFMYKGNIVNIVCGIKTVLICIGAFGMILVAMLLMKKKKEKPMKYMIASDIHGSAYYCRKMMEALEKEQADRLILLGDLLYHGPRNDLPKEYAPKEVIQMLNKEKNRIYNVRGNCDAEVDQMVLEFPVLADYGFMEIDGKTFYMSHGHIYNENNLPPLKPGDIFMHGHTHVLRAEKVGDITILNPGSVSIPKEGNPPTYAILENSRFTIKTFEEERIKEYDL